MIRNFVAACFQSSKINSDLFPQSGWDYRLTMSPRKHRQGAICFGKVTCRRDKNIQSWQINCIARVCLGKILCDTVYIFRSEAKVDPWNDVTLSLSLAKSLFLIRRRFFALLRIMCFNFISQKILNPFDIMPCCLFVFLDLESILVGENIQRNVYRWANANSGKSR